MIVKVEKEQRYNEESPKYYVWVDDRIAETLQNEQQAIEVANAIVKAGFYKKCEIILEKHTS